MKEKKFNFEPLISRHQIKNNDDCYVKIYKPGIMKFNQETLRNLSIGEKGTFIKLYQDISKRTIGFKFFDKINLNNEIRFMKPIHIKTGAICCQISIIPFIKAIKDIKLPTSRLEIKKYNDTDKYLGLGEIYYVEIP